MKRNVVACVIVATTMVAVTFVLSASADARAPHAVAAAAAGFAVDASAAQNKGRYKKQGDECVWDANDGGPNQCTPVTRGRFKKGANDSCAWDANDSGPDQCKPREGRWKKGGGDRCYWDPKDSGPNQCNPRHARR